MCGRDDDPTQHDVAVLDRRTSLGAGGRVKLGRMVDDSLSYAHGTIVDTQLGLSAWLIVQMDDGRRIRIEPMDVTFARDCERSDGSEVAVYVDLEEPGQRTFCCCGMPDESGVIDGNDCRSLGCDPLCLVCGPED